MEKFYIVINNEQKGPFSVKEILEMDINQNTLGWNENYDNWTELKNIEEFKIKLSKKPPPIPKENNEKPLKVIITKEKKEKKNRKEIDYPKILTSLFLLSFITFSSSESFLTSIISLVFPLICTAIFIFSSTLNSSSTFGQVLISFAPSCSKHSYAR